MAKIQKAVEYFQDNNPDSPELNTVVCNTAEWELMTIFQIYITLFLALNSQMALFHLATIISAL